MCFGTVARGVWGAAGDAGVLVYLTDPVGRGAQSVRTGASRPQGHGGGGRVWVTVAGVLQCAFAAGRPSRGWG